MKVVGVGRMADREGYRIATREYGRRQACTMAGHRRNSNAICINVNAEYNTRKEGRVRQGG